jgi:hypothetical protein
MGVKSTLLHGARQALLHAEDALDNADETEMAVRVGLMADEIKERIDDLHDDGSPTVY